MKLEDFFPQQNVGSILKDDAAILSALVIALKPKVLVEIGTYVGASAIVMALAMKQNGFGKIYTVDQNDYNILTNAKDFGIEKHIDFIHGKSQEFVNNFKLPIDMVFYDGEAAESTYSYHFNALRGKIKPGGIYVVHDYKTRSEGHQAFLKGIPNKYVVIDTQKGISLIQI